MTLKLILSALVMIVFGANAVVTVADEIKIGAFHDLSGATADLGRDYALGVAEAVRFVNAQGGVNGRSIRLLQYDYGYRVPEVRAKYKFFKRMGVVAILGWHIVDTDALAAWVARDRIPYLPASYAADLTDPQKSPYHLFAGSDSSSNARAALTAWFDDISVLKAEPSVKPSVTSDNLRVLALRNNSGGLFWIHNRDNAWYEVIVQGQTPVTVSGATMSVPSLDVGEYTVEWWNTYTGAATLGGDTTLTGTTITFADTLDGTGDGTES